MQTQECVQLFLFFMLFNLIIFLRRNFYQILSGMIRRKATDTYSINYSISQLVFLIKNKHLVNAAKITNMSNKNRPKFNHPNIFPILSQKIQKIILNVP